MVSVPKIQLDHLKNQARILSIMLCGSMLFDMLDPALVIASIPGSMFYKVASLTRYRELVSITFLVCGLMVMPYMMMHITGKRWIRHRQIAKLAITGLIASAALWAFLCLTSWRVETGWMTFVFFRQIIGNCIFAGFLGVMLNNELKREKELEERRHVAEKSLLKRIQSAIQIRPHEGEDDSYAVQSYSRHAQ